MDLPLTFAGVTLAGGSDTCLAADISFTPLLANRTVVPFENRAIVGAPYVKRVQKWPWFGSVKNLADPLLHTDAFEYRVEIQAFSLRWEEVGEPIVGYLTCTPEGWTEPFDLLRILPVSASGPLSPVVVGSPGPPGPPGPVDTATLDALYVHEADQTPHPAYDDYLDFTLLFENGLV